VDWRNIDICGNREIGHENARDSAIAIDLRTRRIKKNPHPSGPQYPQPHAKDRAKDSLTQTNATQLIHISAYDDATEMRISGVFMSYFSVATDVDIPPIHEWPLPSRRRRRSNFFQWISQPKRTLNRPDRAPTRMRSSGRNAASIGPNKGLSANGPSTMMSP